MDTSVILRAVPRKGLYTIISLLVAGLVYLGGARVKAAEASAHEAKQQSDEAIRKAASAASTAKQALEEIRDTRAVVEELRRDQLDFYRWQAQQAGDWGRAKRYEDRLRELPSQPR